MVRDDAHVPRALRWSRRARDRRCARCSGTASTPATEARVRAESQRELLIAEHTQLLQLCEKHSPGVLMAFRAGGSTLSSGIFGAGFSLRLARAETRAAGGELAREGDALVLSLPLLTAAEPLPSPVDAPDRAAG